MTEAQKFHFYFPAWNACVRAHGWRKEKGRLVGAGLSTLDPRPSTEELAKVLTFAHQRAITAGRSVTTEDLRHAAHIVALGRDKSSADLTNAEVDRVVTLFKLLADPDNLSVRLDWDAYLRGEDPGSVKRVEFYIRKCPEAYVRSLSASLFGTRIWENLTVKQKARLSMTLANRRPKQVGTSRCDVRAAQRAVPTNQPEPVATVPSDDNTDPDWSVN